MNTPFPFDRQAAGKHFVGRKKDVELLQNLICSGESVALYSMPKAGKKSLIEESLVQARIRGQRFTVAQVDFTKARSTDEILTTFASSLLKACFSSAEELRSAVSELLAGTHFIFDEARYDNYSEAVSSNWLLDDIDIEKVFALPSLLARKKEMLLVVYIKEFQSILFSSDSFALLKALEKVLESRDRSCSFVFTGSMLNAMRQIFEVRKFFWRTVVRFELSPIESTEITEYIYKGFMNQGKVLEKEIILGSAELMKNSMWHINNLFSIVDAIGKGYISKDVVKDALNIMLAIYRPRFYSVICSLTDFQLNLLRAIVEGQTRFSSLAIIDRYHLNSSANVKRLKDALEKKEVVWFDEKDEPHIQDPLFEYWLHKEYFAE